MGDKHKKRTWPELSGKKSGDVACTAISMALKRLEERMTSDHKLRRLVELEQVSVVTEMWIPLKKY